MGTHVHACVYPYPQEYTSSHTYVHTYIQGYTCSCCTGSRARGSQQSRDSNDAATKIGDVDMRFAGRLPNINQQDETAPAHTASPAVKPSKKTSSSPPKIVKPPQSSSSSVQQDSQPATAAPQQPASSNKAPAPVKKEDFEPVIIDEPAPVKHESNWNRDDSAVDATASIKPAPADNIYDYDYSAVYKGTNNDNEDETDPQKQAFNDAMGTNAVFHNYREYCSCLIYIYR
jgi:hypothetical protein